MFFGQLEAAEVRGEEDEPAGRHQFDKPVEQFDMISLDVEEALGHLAVGERRRVDQRQVVTGQAGMGSQKTHRVVPHEAVLVAGQLIQGHISLGPLEIGVRQIDGRRRLRATRGCVDGERAGIAEEVQEPLVGGRFADHCSRDAVVEKEARVEIVGQIHFKTEAAFGDEARSVLLTKTFVLRLAPLSPPVLEKRVSEFDAERIGRGPLHEVEPIGVLRERAVVRPLVFGNVKAVLVAIDDQGDLGDIAVIEAVAGDPLPRRPASQVASPLHQPRAEQLRLLQCLLRQAAEGLALPSDGPLARLLPGGRRRVCVRLPWFRRLGSIDRRLRVRNRALIRLHFPRDACTIHRRRLRPEELEIGALDPAVEELAPPVRGLAQESFEIGACREHVERPGL